MTEHGSALMDALYVSPDIEGGRALELCRPQGDLVGRQAFCRCQAIRDHPVAVITTLVVREEPQRSYAKWGALRVLSSGTSDAAL
jgi:hypothetical protein